jgi:AcrR family transcriptional regulator
MSSAKDKILNAASKLFLEGGSTALSVRAISKKAGVSTIGIYSHFKGKEGILDELYIQGFDLVYDAMHKVEREGKKPKDIILEGVKGYLDIAQTYEAHYRLIFGESHSDYTPSSAAQEASRRAFNMLLELTSLLIPQDSEDSAKRRIALEIWAPLHGYVSLKHHITPTMVMGDQWFHLALGAIDTHIDAIIAQQEIQSSAI